MQSHISELSDFSTYDLNFPLLKWPISLLTIEPIYSLIFVSERFDVHVYSYTMLSCNLGVLIVILMHPLEFF